MIVMSAGDRIDHTWKYKYKIKMTSIQYIKREMEYSNPKAK